MNEYGLKYSKGKYPWSLVDKDGPTVVVIPERILEDDFPYAICVPAEGFTPFGVLGFLVKDTENEEETKANAYLVKAAPLLFEVVKHCWRFFRGRMTKSKKEAWLQWITEAALMCACQGGPDEIPTFEDFKKWRLKNHD